MSVKKRSYSKEMKFQAVVKMIKGEETIQALCSHYGIHQSVLFKWKKAFMEKGASIFEDRSTKTHQQQETDNLERKVGQLTMELDFLKRALERSI